MLDSPGDIVEVSVRGSAFFTTHSGVFAIVAMAALFHLVSHFPISRRSIAQFVPSASTDLTLDGSNKPESTALPAETESLRRLPGSREDSGEKEVVEMTVYTGPTVAQAGSGAAAEQPVPPVSKLYIAAVNAPETMRRIFAPPGVHPVHRRRVVAGELKLEPEVGNERGVIEHVGLYGKFHTATGRWSCAAGLSYGYSLSLSRYFNIDFTIGIGYLWGEYKKYRVEDDCYVWGRCR